MKRSADLLVVDDEQGIRDLLKSELRALGHRVQTAANGQQARDFIDRKHFDLAICDVHMPGMDGMELLKTTKERDPSTQVIMLTGYATIETAVEAMKFGAYDFLQKPFRLDELTAVVERGLERQELQLMLAAYQASQAIFQTVKIENLFPIIVDLASGFLRADDLCIFVLESESQLKLSAGSRGLSEGDRQRRTAFCRGLLERAGAWDKPLILERTEENDADGRGPLDWGEIQSILHFPLVIEGRRLGAILACRRSSRSPFAQSDALGMAIFSSQAAQAVYNGQLFEALRQKVQELEAAQKQIERAQGELIQSEKMASVGRLAAGIAHEINNPLSGILGFTQLLLEESCLTAQQRQDLESIQTQTQRCRSIIQNLLHFSRRRTPRKEELDLRSLLEKTLALAKPEMTTAGIDLCVDLAKSLPLVYGDPNPLQQVLFNLLTNSKQALEGRPQKTVFISGWVEEDWVWIRLRDTGCGIPPEILGKIFDPFFTTKPVGEGTGLGLSICYGILQDHGGTITAESEPGAGTAFTLRLPVYRKSALS